MPPGCLVSDGGLHRVAPHVRVAVSISSRTGSPLRATPNLRTAGLGAGATGYRDGSARRDLRRCDPLPAIPLAGATSRRNAWVRPPAQPRDEGDLAQAPRGRSIIMAAVGFVVAVAALGALLSS